MISIIILAAISAILGAMFLISEDLIKRLETSMNKTVAQVSIQSEKSNNKAVGLWLIIFGLILLTIYWHYKV